MDNVIVSGPAISVFYVRSTDLDNNVSNTFSFFQLESKSYRTKQCWPYHIGSYIFFYKNLHIEPFNYLYYKKGLF